MTTAAAKAARTFLLARAHGLLLLLLLQATRAAAAAAPVSTRLHAFSHRLGLPRRASSCWGGELRRQAWPRWVQRVHAHGGLLRLGARQWRSGRLKRGTGPERASEEARGEEGGCPQHRRGVGPAAAPPWLCAARPKGGRAEAFSQRRTTRQRLVPAAPPQSRHCRQRGLCRRRLWWRRARRRRPTAPTVALPRLCPCGALLRALRAPPCWPSPTSSSARKNCPSRLLLGMNATCCWKLSWSSRREDVGGNAVRRSSKEERNALTW